MGAALPSAIEMAMPAAIPASSKQAMTKIATQAKTIIVEGASLDRSKLDTTQGAASGLTPDDPSFDISDARDVEALLAAEDRYFWHASRNRIIASRLASLGIRPGARILELGCGSGCVASYLGRAGFRVTGVDGHDALLQIAQRRAPQLTFRLCDLRQGFQAGAEGLFDAVALFDVLEHLDDPGQALADALACARPGGFVVGTVPALMALWSSIDEHAGHKVRYSGAALAALLKGAAGSTLVEIAPFNRSLVPLLWVQRKMVGRGGGASDSIRNLAVPWWPINRALYALAMAEQMLSPILDRTPIGGSSLWFAIRRHLIQAPPKDAR
jgi:2-polyprenyl-3-methyl-5-hydroxy-6-metoxy-1,4-benzoquinol methylase